MRGKEKVDRSGYLFSNRDLTALLIPLVIEQLLSVLVGMADSIMVASVGEAAVSGVSLVDNIMVLLINVLRHWQQVVLLWRDSIWDRSRERKQVRRRRS